MTEFIQILSIIAFLFEKCSSKCTHTDSESIHGSTQDFEPNDHVRFLDDTFEDVQERENAKAVNPLLFTYSRFYCEK